MMGSRWIHAVCARIAGHLSPIGTRYVPTATKPLGPRYVERATAGSLIGGFIPHARFNTILILLINCGLFAATALKSGGGWGDVDGRVLYAFGAKIGLANLDGQWWRLVTAGFLHGGFFHILMNSWVLFDLGAQVEEIYGASRMWVIYFLASVAGFLASAWWTAGLSIGASAGICGLIGAMIALGMRHRSPMGAAIRGMYIRWAIYTLVMGLLIRQVDNAAHIGGLAAGFAVAYLAETPKATGPSESVWKVAAYCCVALTVVSFLKMWMQMATSLNHLGL